MDPTSLLQQSLVSTVPHPMMVHWSLQTKKPHKLLKNLNFSGVFRFWAILSRKIPEVHTSGIFRVPFTFLCISLLCGTQFGWTVMIVTQLHYRHMFKIMFLLDVFTQLEEGYSGTLLWHDRYIPLQLLYFFTVATFNINQHHGASYTNTGTITSLPPLPLIPHRCR